MRNSSETGPGPSDWFTGSVYIDAIAAPSNGSMYEAGDVRIENVPDPTIVEVRDAVVRITRACICGSDLWPYKTMERNETRGRSLQRRNRRSAGRQRRHRQDPHQPHLPKDRRARPSPSRPLRLRTRTRVTPAPR